MKLKNRELNMMKDNFINKTYLIDASNNQDESYQDYSLRRVQNDIYGNPLYRLTLTRGQFIHSKIAHRNYAGSQYYLLQSYDIKSDLDRLFTDLDVRVTEIFEAE